MQDNNDFPSGWGDSENNPFGFGGQEDDASSPWGDHTASSSSASQDERGFPTSAHAPDPLSSAAPQDDQPAQSPAPQKLNTAKIPHSGGRDQTYSASAPVYAQPHTGSSGIVKVLLGLVAFLILAMAVLIGVLLWQKSRDDGGNSNHLDVDSVIVEQTKDTSATMTDHAQDTTLSSSTVQTSQQSDMIPTQSSTTTGSAATTQTVNTTTTSASTAPPVIANGSSKKASNYLIWDLQYGYGADQGGYLFDADNDGYLELLTERYAGGIALECHSLKSVDSVYYIGSLMGSDNPYEVYSVIGTDSKPYVYYSHEGNADHLKTFEYGPSSYQGYANPRTGDAVCVYIDYDTNSDGQWIASWDIYVTTANKLSDLSTVAYNSGSETVSKAYDQPSICHQTLMQTLAYKGISIAEDSKYVKQQYYTNRELLQKLKASAGSYYTERNGSFIAGADASVGIIVTKGAVLNLRAQPSTDAEVYVQIPDGTFVEVLYADVFEEWAYISVTVSGKNYQGYVKTDYLDFDWGI